MRKTDLFRIFADAIRPQGWEALWEELSRRVEHYILKGVTLRFVFGLRNFHNRMLNKNNAGWLPRGVVYTLRSVQEVRVASMHTLRVYYILQRGCLLCLFFQQGCGRPRRQAGRS